MAVTGNTPALSWSGATDEPPPPGCPLPGDSVGRPLCVAAPVGFGEGDAGWAVEPGDGRGEPPAGVAGAAGVGVAGDLVGCATGVGPGVRAGGATGRRDGGSLPAPVPAPGTPDDTAGAAAGEGVDDALAAGRPGAMGGLDGGAWTGSNP